MLSKPLGNRSNIQIFSAIKNGFKKIDHSTMLQMNLNIRPLDVFIMLRYHLASMAQHLPSEQEVPSSNPG